MSLNEKLIAFRERLMATSEAHFFKLAHFPQAFEVWFYAPGRIDIVQVPKTLSGKEFYELVEPNKPLVSRLWLVYEHAKECLND